MWGIRSRLGRHFDRGTTLFVCFFHADVHIPLLRDAACQRDNDVTSLPANDGHGLYDVIAQVTCISWLCFILTRTRVSRPLCMSLRCVLSLKYLCKRGFKSACCETKCHLLSYENVTRNCRMIKVLLYVSWLLGCLVNCDETEVLLKVIIVIF